MTPEQFDRRSQLLKLLTETKKRAKKKGLLFDLDFDWLARAHDRQGGKCALTGISFKTRRSERFSRNPYAPSIDRIRSRGGYTKNNCRLVCCAVNLALGEWGEGVFSEVAHAYTNRKLAEMYP